MRTRYGRIEIACSNGFSAPVLGSRTSPYLQSKLVLLGSEQVFADVAELVSSLLGIETNASQVYRICQAASQALDEQLLDTASQELAQQLCSNEQPVYGMVDGSMLLTDEGWKEVKVGRVFTAKAKENTGADKPQWQMGRSEYVARQGHYQAFTAKFEALLAAGSTAEKVFVTDGAVWIDNWLSQAYPDATHILDYYHVTEKLALAAPAATRPKQWFEQQCEQLLQGKSREVEQAVFALPLPAAEKDKLTGYLQNNHQRMRYQEFRQRKLMIGSGPIEAAHRTVLQVRIKRSGQRWSEKGAENMIRLRTALKSQKFDLVYNLFRN
jgi:hypothetical protein